MKKLIALLLLLFMSVSLIGCSSPLKAGISGKHASRDEIFTYVRNNYQKLMSFPYDEMVEKYPRDGLTSVDNRKEFIESRCESDGMVSGVFLHDGRVLDFYCGSKAAVSGTETVGFYYSEDDTPHGLEFDYLPCTETSPGVFVYEDDEKYDRKLYTERIRENWFYYEQIYY